MSHFDATYDQMVVEFWDVAEENEATFLEYFKRVIVGSLKSSPGYAGTLFLREQTLPGWTRVIQAHQGTRTLGVHTNATVNLSALLTNEYTLATVHLFTERDPQLMLNFFSGFKQLVPDWETRHADKPDEPASPLWMDQMVDLYSFSATGDTTGVDEQSVTDAVQITKVMSHDFFGLVRNHWDVFYDVLETT